MCVYIYIYIYIYIYVYIYIYISLSLYIYIYIYKGDVLGVPGKLLRLPDLRHGLREARAAVRFIGAYR